jgi:hypothetical protein
VPNTNGMLERKEKDHGEEGEREIFPYEQAMSVKKLKD